MAATTASALKQIIEALGLGLAAYRRKAPADAVMPYVVLTDGISEVTEQGGDAGAGDTVIENVQLDLWERYLDPDTGHVVESPTLANNLKRGLHGKAPVSAAGDTPVRIYGIRIPFSARAESADDNTVRTRMSVNVHRAL